MRGKCAITACVGLALLAGGCTPLEKMYFREGIGTELYSPDVLPATELQNIYLDHLCRQSLPFVGPNAPSCSQQELPPTAWSLIVQAGMNDIDSRCDSYLAWLDQKKRENSAILTQIAAVRVAVDALTNPAVATGISPLALAAVSAAFGLATNTFNNINSLLLQVEHSTVQSVVFINRRDFRDSLLGLAVTNKPMAVHALRSYLEICMPMTISANINSTVTVFQQTGPGILGKRPLVVPPSIGVPLRSVQAIVRPDRPAVNFDPAHEAVVASFDRRVHSIRFVQNILRRLCVPPSELESVSTKTNARIQAYQQYRRDTGDTAVTVTGKLSNRDLGIVAGETICATDRYQNFYEKDAFPQGINDPGLVAVMNKKLVSDRQLPPNATVDQIRSRIPDLRRLLEPKLKLRARELSDQLTLDLVNELAR